MRIIDGKARARAAMMQRGLMPGFYWARSGVEGGWVPVELDEDGYVWQIGQDTITAPTSLIQFGPRLEEPK